MLDPQPIIVCQDGSVLICESDESVRREMVMCPHDALRIGKESPYKDLREMFHPNHPMLEE